ncbi:MAG: hypothetical protein M3176_18625 [Chloroflexota bacterium]|nr:hypothetical protein [Chloroflexota bacterium]
MEPTKDKKPAPDTVPDAPGERTPPEKARDPRSDTGAEGTSKAVYDDAIEEAAEDIHG